MPLQTRLYRRLELLEQSVFVHDRPVMRPCIGSPFDSLDGSGDFSTASYG
jgi:hypothetical protein